MRDLLRRIRSAGDTNGVAFVSAVQGLDLPTAEALHALGLVAVPMWPDHVILSPAAWLVTEDVPAHEIGDLALVRPARPSWDDYFMQIARVVATRATCDRKHVGAVLVRNRAILATGYNGAVRGMPHCDEVGHMMEDGHCVRVNHAETNAFVQAARHGVRVDGAELYVTASPCWPCFRMVLNAGVGRVVYGEFYRDDRIFAAAAARGVELTCAARAPT